MFSILFCPSTNNEAFAARCSNEKMYLIEELSLSNLSSVIECRSDFVVIAAVPKDLKILNLRNLEFSMEIAFALYSLNSLESISITNDVYKKSKFEKEPLFSTPKFKLKKVFFERIELINDQIYQLAKQ